MVYQVQVGQPVHKDLKGQEENQGLQDHRDSEDLQDLMVHQVPLASQGQQDSLGHQDHKDL
jgi:hypothetical protein